MRQQKRHGAQPLYGRVIFWPLFLLAVTPLVLTTPVHAADDNTVELTISSDAYLKHKQSSTDPYLHEATTPVKIKTAKPRGFNLTIHADSADLVNTKDNSRRIKGATAFIDKESGREMLMGMNANSWGYRLEEGYGTKHMPDGFMHVPAGDEAPSVIVDTVSEYDNAGCKGKTKCEVHMTFGAAIAPNSLAAGKYSTTVTYTATAKPKPAPIVDPTTCKSGDPKSACQVDLDPKMIPVKYNAKDAVWESVADSKKGEWYNYKDNSDKKTMWANAVTVKDPSKYKGKNMVVEQSDILGFWVYIPRYRYKVLRFSGSDPAVPAQNFTIEFENKDSKAVPTANGTWATHPAFTLDIKKPNGSYIHKELNGIWFGKFETTGTTEQPTVLPNEAHIADYYRYMGDFYSISKTLGVDDPNNVGGSGFTTKHNHNLTKFSSHMVNNNDWGAATYLSASKYGAGYNGVQINANSARHNNSYGTTGCGPQSNGNTSSYSDSGTLGTPQACGSADRAYNGSIGKLASTTNNVYGIYDMSGGGWEYVAASYTSDVNLHNSSTKRFSQPAHPPYVNTYNITNLNKCTFKTCGGQALYETNNGTGEGSGNNQWNGQWSDMGGFASSSPWFRRGGGYSYGPDAGLFYLSNDNGHGSEYGAFRVALAPAPQD